MKMYLPRLAILGAVLFMVAPLWVTGASAETLKMEELEVEGEVHKPQVLFITDRSYELPQGEGKKRMRTDFLSEVVADGRRLARQRELPPTEVKIEE